MTTGTSAPPHEAARILLVDDHEVVRDMPELFTPVAPGDKGCRSRLRQHLERAARTVAAELERARSGARPAAAPLLTASARSSRRPAPLLTATRGGPEPWRL